MIKVNWIGAVAFLLISNVCALAQDNQEPTTAEVLISRQDALAEAASPLGVKLSWRQNYGSNEIRRAWLRGDMLLMETWNPAKRRFEILSSDVTKGGRLNWILGIGDHRLARAPHVGRGSITFLTESDSGMIVVDLNGSRIHGRLRTRIGVIPASEAQSTSDTVFIGNYLAQRLVAASADNGLKGWDFPIEGLCINCPMLTRTLPTNLVICASEKGELTALVARSSGASAPRRASWKRQLAGGIEANPRMVDSNDKSARPLIVVPCKDGNLYGLDAATGTSEWVLRTNRPFIASASVAGGRVFAKNTERMFCLDLKTGKRLWYGPGTDTSKEYAASQLFSEPAGYETTDRVLAADDARVFFLTGKNQVYRCNSKNGEIECAERLGAFDFFLTNEVTGELLLGTRDGNFLALK
jgi:outer membrane protein assembly factor BamB